MLPALLLSLVGTAGGAPAKDLQRTPLAAGASAGGRWAVVVGVDQYEDPNIRSLRYAANDARAVADALVAGGWDPAHVVTMWPASERPDRQPTRANVFDQLGRLRETIQGGDDLVFYFSGHGMRARSGGSLLLPQDLRSAAPEETGIAMDALARALEDIDVKRRTIILDACRDRPLDAKGGSTWGSPRYDAETGTRVLYSSAADKVSYEDDDRRLGAFTGALVDALRGAADGAGGAAPDGYIDFGELLAYTRDELGRLCLERGICQSPRQDGESSGDFALVRVAIRSPGPKGPPAASAGATSPTSPPVRAPASVAAEPTRLPSNLPPSMLAAETACAKDDASACWDLGFGYEMGKTGKIDLTRALAEYRRSCDLGYALGCRYAGKILRREDGPANVIEAANRLDRGCALGDAEACDDAWSLRGGAGVPPSVSAADAACAKDDASACWDLGFAHEMGKTGKIDLTRALAEYRRSCDLGNALGCRYAGKILRRDNSPASVIEAANRLDRGCALGDAEACDDAWSLRGAAGVPPSVSADDAACAKDDASACWDLGFAYEVGKAGKIDPTGALVDYRKSCDLGYALGCLYAGNLLRAGTNPASIIEAADRYDHGCTLGNADACDAAAALRRGTPP